MKKYVKIIYATSSILVLIISFFSFIYSRILLKIGVLKQLAGTVPFRDHAVTVFVAPWQAELYKYSLIIMLIGIPAVVVIGLILLYVFKIDVFSLKE